MILIENNNSIKNHISNKNELKHFLKIESKLYGMKNTRIPLFAIKEKHILWKHSALLRKTEYYTNINNTLMALIYRFRLLLIQNKYCLRIPRNVFDCGLKIMHLGPVLVNSNARVGKYCILHMNTGIVAGGTNDLVPCLGDNIVVGFGAVVLGGITLADDIAIGANAVVNKSFVEKNITIAGVPAKKISDTGRIGWSEENRKKNNNDKGNIK